LPATLIHSERNTFQPEQRIVYKEPEASCMCIVWCRNASWSNLGEN